MRDFQINFTEHNIKIFGEGVRKTETARGISEQTAIKSFLKHKKARGKIVVVNTTQHIPIKEPM